MKEDLGALRQLAGLRADRSAARLAKVQALIDALDGKARALRDARPDPPASVAEAVMRDKWLRWRGEQLTLLNQRIAQLQVVAQPQREAHARDTARQGVLAKLEAKRRR